MKHPWDFWACRQNCASPPRAESLTCRSPSHLLLRFESNGSHRHRRVTLSDSSLQQARAALRADLRRARRSISGAERARCARRVTLFADRTGLLHPALRIGLYLALPEELDTAALLALARRRGCRIFLPRIDAAPDSRSGDQGKVRLICSVYSFCYRWRDFRPFDQELSARG